MNYESPPQAKFFSAFVTVAHKKSAEICHLSGGGKGYVCPSHPFEWGGHCPPRPLRFLRPCSYHSLSLISVLSLSLITVSLLSPACLSLITVSLLSPSLSYL